MSELAVKVDALLQRYGMDPERVDVDECARAFQRDMEAGLNGDPSARMMMLPTYLTAAGELPLDEPVVVVDAGGTNFRVALVTMREGGPQVDDLSVSPMPGSRGAITKEEFVDQVTDQLLPLVKKSRRVGLCFSYAAEILPNRDGKVVAISKQVQINGSTGMLLGEEFSAALDAKGVGGVVFTVLNDTVAALLGGVADTRDENFDGYIGLIYGTGVNTCYAERSENVTKLKTPWDAPDMLINMEAGSFADVNLGEGDKLLDAASVDPGKCHYEKMISGRYLGEVMYHTLRFAARDGLFSNSMAEELRKLSGLTTAEGDAFCARPYGGNVLARMCDTEEDREVTYLILDRCVERAARLVCGNLAGIFLQTGWGKRRHRPTCIVAEGSTFYKGQLFKGKLERIAAEYMTGTLGRYFVFRRTEDANLIGTAAAALLSSH
ncbi:MAG: hexokinase [Clostridia bacterium]|nr:hexokinase [Clostridia bacterium]